MTVCSCTVLKRLESWGHTLWSNEEEVPCVQRDTPTCQPPDVSDCSRLHRVSAKTHRCMCTEMYYTVAALYLYSHTVDFLRAAFTFSVYSQVPFTTWERPSHGVHSSTVFQAEVQSAAQISPFALLASRTGTEAHLPSPGGETEAALTIEIRNIFVLVEGLAIATNDNNFLF